ncbi:hypothetical protein ElyMa_004855000 [Elysia marginata]|uniref:Uncharacterized protein n=1 Tax=Elysia marginata TaxID=1093978 RepID=A0AAV4ITB6_9GAST|nr:hypothetical protein ElyMa_004855000 [Elysia marginata]
MDPSDPRRAHMPYIDDQFDEYTAALFFRFMGSQVQLSGFYRPNNSQRNNISKYHTLLDKVLLARLF